MNTNVRDQYWSQKLGFPVKPKDNIPINPTQTEDTNPIFSQYWRDKNSQN